MAEASWNRFSSLLGTKRNWCDCTVPATSRQTCFTWQDRYSAVFGTRLFHSPHDPIHPGKIWLVPTFAIEERRIGSGRKDTSGHTLRRYRQKTRMVVFRISILAFRSNDMQLRFPESNTVGEWLQFLSSLSTPVIAVVAVLHVLFFLFLRIWCARDTRAIASVLDDFTRGLRHRSVLDRSMPLTTQIDAFVQDVNEVLADPTRSEDRATCLQRLKILDEKRRYFESLSFETLVHSARTMIEAYPLSGVLGTVLAIGSALQADAAAKSAASVNLVMERFGDSIWSTFTGLFAAIVLMFINSLLEVRFARLTDSRTHVRDMVARAKRELAMAGTPRAEISA